MLCGGNSKKSAVQSSNIRSKRASWLLRISTLFTIACTTYRSAFGMRCMYDMIYYIRNNIYYTAYLRYIQSTKCGVILTTYVVKFHKSLLAATGRWRFLKLQVFFRTRAINCRALLRKITYKGRTSQKSTRHYRVVEMHRTASKTYVARLFPQQSY